MQEYQEMTILPNADVSVSAIWSQLFQKVHLALVKVKDTQDKVSVGLGFPQYGLPSFPLGTKLRLFGTEPGDLKRLNLDLGIMADYVHSTSIREVPTRVQSHISYVRYQPKGNSAKQRYFRHKAQKDNISLEEARLRYQEKSEQTIDLPYLQVLSLSSLRRFPLFIEKTTHREATTGRFSTYGLSQGKVTVPDF